MPPPHALVGACAGMADGREATGGLEAKWAVDALDATAGKACVLVSGPRPQACAPDIQDPLEAGADLA